jgi:anthranilate phosphoribosyltransferase
MIETALKHVEAGRHLSMEQMAEALGHIMAGRCAEEEIARLLTALHRKGETVAEVAGAAAAMRRQMAPIRTRRVGVIDTCGTGGDASRTFNISTAAALVTAAAGVPVAKHGNRGITSRSGSADVLAALGVNVEAGVACVEACLEELGICFCFAPLLHAAMKHVAAVRKRLPHPTIFNILGPLVNPASAPFQLLGVGRPELRPLLAEALGMLQKFEGDSPIFAGAKIGTVPEAKNGTVPSPRALVVHGADRLDEVTLGDVTFVTEAAVGNLRSFTWSPTDFGLEEATREEMLVDGPQESAAMIRGMLDGRRGPARDIVLVNAAAALWTAGRHPSLRECVRLAAEAVDSGAARDLLARLAERTHVP